MKRRTIAGLAIAAVLLLSANIHPTPAQAQEQCFQETGHCMSGRIAQYWNQNGGLPVFGFPIGDQTTGQIEGKQVTFQLFERNRLELHPENAAPYDVLLGRLGAGSFKDPSWQTWPISLPRGDYFPQSRQAIDPGFIQYFHTNCLNLDGNPLCTRAESLALFGLPITQAYMSPAADGQSYWTQWFERARIEFHPQNEDPFKILLGRLGAEASIPYYPSYASYEIPWGPQETLVNFHALGSNTEYEIKVSNGVFYRKTDQVLFRPVLTAGTSYEVIKGLIIYLGDQAHVTITVETAKWRLLSE